MSIQKSVLVALLSFPLLSEAVDRPDVALTAFSYGQIKLIEVHPHAERPYACFLLPDGGVVTAGLGDFVGLSDGEIILIDEIHLEVRNTIQVNGNEWATSVTKWPIALGKPAGVRCPAYDGRPTSATS